MSKQSRARCHHSLPSPRRRISSELRPQKVQGPPPRDPFYTLKGRAVHFLISSDSEKAGHRPLPPRKPLAAFR
ncbi:hypothetical protein AVEN_255053-1 [Araneus ventricosus]|uniref:Uncharacterized protein n=1 Tax=Araneus ventricosus TaxID=182803 RepID=A0A4Y2QKA3_ARAVE|nr:hypothetical protein AVEN_255053-1 [Araneus ventricosus]